MDNSVSRQARRSFVMIVAALSALTLLGSRLPLLGSQGENKGDKRIVSNPYKNVKWGTVEKHKAALHMHTLQSDGYNSAKQVVNAYKNAGYSIIAITDHDWNEPNARIAWGELDATHATVYPKEPRPHNFPANPTWPWTDYGAPSPEELGVVGIQGNELTYRHHINSYYSDYGVWYDKTGSEAPFGGIVRSEWESPVSELGSKRGGEPFPDAGTWRLEVTDKNKYRYIRVDKLGGKTFNFAEVKILSNGVDVAWNASATASSSLNDRYSPERGNDGDVNSIWHTGDPLLEEEWWQVDLGESYSIDSIELVARQSHGQDSTRNNFRILASNDPDFKVKVIKEIWEDDQLHEIRDRGGLAILNHPGIDDAIPWWVRQPLEWYIKRYQIHPADCLVGIEVTNSADRDYDEGLWDQLLARFMPERPIWGFGTDDMHNLSGVKLSYSVFLLDQLNDSNVRQAMETGQFYFTRGNNSVSYLEGPPNIDVFPVVTNIEVCEEGNTVAISAQNYTEIRWISVDEPADKIEKGNIVHRGPQVKLDELRGVGSFLRVEIENQAGVTYLQPFGTGPISNL